MTHEQLAKRIAEVALLRGEFTLRSGRKSNYYLDKYRFETQPDVLAELGKLLADRVTGAHDAHRRRGARRRPARRRRGHGREQTVRLHPQPEEGLRHGQADRGRAGARRHGHDRRRRADDRRAGAGGG
jgi:hypothetical protein